MQTLIIALIASIKLVHVEGLLDGILGGSGSSSSRVNPDGVVHGLNPLLGNPLCELGLGCDCGGLLQGLDPTVGGTVNSVGLGVDCYRRLLAARGKKDDDDEDDDDEDTEESDSEDKKKVKKKKEKKHGDGTKKQRKVKKPSKVKEPPKVTESPKVTEPPKVKENPKVTEPPIIESGGCKKDRNNKHGSDDDCDCVDDDVSVDWDDCDGEQTKCGKDSSSDCDCDDCGCGDSDCKNFDCSVCDAKK